MTGYARAAHLFQCFYACRALEMCKEEGISEEEINRGAEIAFVRKKVRETLRGIYGNPMYGSWPARAAEDERNELLRRGVTAEEIEATI